MKKIFLLFAFLGVVSLSVDAQTCPYASKAKAASVENSSDAALTAAAKAAAMDENIEKKVCSTSGKVSYVRKDVCATSGKVSYANVEYCTKSEKFVNVSPKGGADAKAVSAGTLEGGKKASCTAAEKASCTKKAAATKVSATSKKSCAKGASSACCAKKAKGAKASAEKAATKEAKLVKMEEQ